MITEAEARAWLDAYREAWVRRDPDRIVALFTPDGAYRERRFEPPDTGHAGIRDYWQRNVVARERDISFTVAQVMVAGDQAFAHWQARFTWVPDGSFVELDAVFRLSFAPASGNGLRLATALEEWIDRKGA